MNKYEIWQTLCMCNTPLEESCFEEPNYIRSTSSFVKVFDYGHDLFAGYLCWKYCENLSP